MRPGTIQAQVLEVLQNGPRRTVDVCQELIDLDNTAIALALRRLCAQGVVARIDNNPRHGRGYHAVWDLSG